MGGNIEVTRASWRAAVTTANEREVRAHEAAFAEDLGNAVEAAFRAVRALGLPSAEAADVVQEASIRAWRYRHTRRGEFRPWFLAIVYREARRPRRRWLTVPAFWSARSDEPGEGFSSTVAASLAALPRRQRLALSLRYDADLTIAGVAHVMHINESAAKQLLARARRTLRSSLGNVDEADL